MNVATVVPSRSLWVYKNNAMNQPYQWSWGDWEEFFDSGKSGRVLGWGGTEWMGSGASRKAAFAMRTGDLVLCMQSDRRVAVGLAEVVDQAGDWANDHGVIERRISLRVVERFAAGVPLLDQRRTNKQLGQVRALRPGPIQSIYETSPAEASSLLRACGVSLPATRKGRRQPDLKRVERAAVDFVTAHYRAARWTISSVEEDKIGYDLVAQRGRIERHLEVKGLSGTEPRFVLTAREYREAGADSRFRLCLVTSATTPGQQHLREWTGVDLLAQATFSPTAYAVEFPSS